ncbi:AIS_HP2_G0020060.mRNA.1.CDS.1 [Saccharomyces cerevisiae]|nr:AIS_HP2_G0020060.mRNA.1.CDS.1 [Saccharomyces cerevisiae]CAI6524041.1 AIS_HP2_G0020060.mRNA.1.CDS.1 [Saccharomyces cerevisiae]
MCILMATRAHPDYELILISNRDEFLARKTHATCWHNDDFILSPYDLAKTSKEKQIFGTWSGINKEGKLATILNLKLDGQRDTIKSKSRGLLPFTFLSTHKADFQNWDNYDKFEMNYDGLNTTGDFNFFYGDVIEKQYKLIDSLGRTFNVLDSTCKSNLNSYMAVSNGEFYNSPSISEQAWKKVKVARDGLEKLVLGNIESDEETIISNCFQLASKSSLPGTASKPNALQMLADPNVIMNTIYVPPLRRPPDDDLGASIPDGDYYGTRSQIVLLVSKNSSKVTFIERVLYSSDEDVNHYSVATPKEEKRFEFKL